MMERKGEWESSFGWSVMSESLRPQQAPLSHQAILSMGIFQAKTLLWVAMPFSRGSSQPKDWTQADSLLSEPPEKPKFYFI